MNDWLRFAPKEWRDAFEESVTFPFRGPMRDEHGVVHEITGNYTVCGRQWAGETRFGHPQHNRGWVTPLAGTAYTCLGCLRGIHLPED